MPDNSKKLLLLNNQDNILVAIGNIEADTNVRVGDDELPVRANTSLGHKIARRDIEEGETIFKYGMSIGVAAAPISRGEHVHIHNMRSSYTPFTNVE
ncbi:hypothetical protein E1162_11990 [Rhodobacteraceae bacterium RKSG542]|uniref:UxaA family hydrolase n=1 Tax=Pseudovibrio flavus TaxID=2529854 RepID=UPI0012BBFC73|nr:UxaA family hydrolase [Pseudovibrio flavus]MTI17958.1 hypothetical protein [Pseudovibrio flavus]